MKINISDPDIETIRNRIKKGIYDLEPDFQRDEVWSREKQQKLIDSIMRGWHIPPIYMVNIEDKENFEVLDGKQRLKSISSFLDDIFSFNSDFSPKLDEFDEIHGKKFSQLPLKWQTKFLGWPIRVFEVRDVRKDEATELFLRLNQGVVVTASEKRNCIYGPVKNNLRKTIITEFSDLFNPERLGFENRRMAYQDMLDTAFFLEDKESLDYRPNSKALEEMYFSQEINSQSIERLKQNLGLLRDCLMSYKQRLTKSLFISFYWFIRDLNGSKRYDLEKVSNFLNAFEEWRDKQIDMLDDGKAIDSRFVEFDNYLSYGWLDQESLKGRNKILLHFYETFERIGKLGDTK